MPIRRYARGIFLLRIAQERAVGRPADDQIREFVEGHGPQNQASAGLVPADAQTDQLQHVPHNHASVGLVPADAQTGQLQHAPHNHASVGLVPADAETSQLNAASLADHSPLRRGRPEWRGLKEEN